MASRQRHEAWLAQAVESYLRWAISHAPAALLNMSPEELEKRARDEMTRRQVVARLKRRHPRLKWIESGVTLRGNRSNGKG